MCEQEPHFADLCGHLLDLNPKLGEVLSIESLLYDFFQEVGERLERQERKLDKFIEEYIGIMEESDD